MSSGSQWPSRPSVSDVSGPLRATDGGMRQAPTHGYPDLPAINSFCQEALDGALELVRADGGEVAILDVEGQVMITRARRKRPPRLPAYGAPSRPSQPISQTGMLDVTDPIDSQVTQLLPSAQMARAYAPDQGLIGDVWKRRESLNIRLDEHTAGAVSTMLVEADARNHLAAPIFRPEALNHLSGRGPVIGVIRVFNRDQLWSYSANDKLLLELHADRLGRTLAQLDSAIVNVRRGDLVGALRELGGAGPTLGDLLARAAEISLRQVNAYSFTAYRYHSDSDTVTVEYATRPGATPPDARMAVSELPPWLQRAVRGEYVVERAPQGGSPLSLMSLGWSEDALIRCALAAPLSTNNRVFGAIVVTSPQIDAFTDDAAILFEALALATSTFAENARLVENARHTIEQVNEQRLQLSALNNSVQTLNASLNLDETLQKLAQQASLMTTAQVCAVFLREEGSAELVCRAVYAKGNEAAPTLINTTIPLAWRNIGERLMGETFLKEEGLDADPGARDSATALMARVGAKTFHAAPIVRQEVDAEKEQNLGALVIFTPRQSLRHAPEELILLKGLASQAAIAISNARLYNKLQEAYAQLQELDRLKDDFILTVSHEFRTPLTAIEGYVTLINKHGHKLDQSKLQQFATEIHQATVQLAGMISMLADANRMSAQPLHITPRPVNLAAVAADAIGVQPPDAKERIQVRVADDVWIGGDDERLPLIFSNLIGNAIKYSGAGKTCRVVARIVTRHDLVASGRKLQVSGDDAQEWAIVTVEDEGPGISAEDQTRLFQKFVRLSQSLVTPVRGTGLGLWICRQYVDALGGDIWVESRLGQGSRFSFCLPRVTAPAS